MLTSLQRVIKSGIIHFWRNSWLSAATVLIMILMLFVIEGLLFSSLLAKTVLDNIQNKIDISVYLKTTAEESNITALEEEIEKMDEVKSVELLSAEEVLRRFKETEKNKPKNLEALDELGENPFGPTLNIKAKNPAQYFAVSAFLEQEKFKETIDSINYKQNETIISRLQNLINFVNKSGLILSFILAGIAILVAFNTIRLAIFTAKEEISVMRLVGASSWFIRGPFLVEGALHGILAATLTLVFSYALLFYSSPHILKVLPGINLLNYFQTNFFALFGLLITIGALLGVISSFIAVHRYLKV